MTVDWLRKGDKTQPDTLNHHMEEKITVFVFDYIETKLGQKVTEIYTNRIFYLKVLKELMPPSIGRT